MNSTKPKFRGYYDRYRHRAAVYAMQSLIANHPGHNSTAIAIRAVEHADALLKELNITPDIEEVPD